MLRQSICLSCLVFILALPGAEAYRELVTVNGERKHVTLSKAEGRAEVAL